VEQVQEAKELGGWQRPEGVSGKLEVLVGGEGWLWRPQALLQYLDLEVGQGRMG
jgi:hypothetical protein